MSEEAMIIKGLSDLPEAAERLLEWVGGRHSRVVAFYGEMGAGKTTLIKEICRQLGVEGEDEVNSPSFAIVNEYLAKRSSWRGREGNDKDSRMDVDTACEIYEPVYHFDFYRIKDIEEAFDFGYEEYFYSGNLCLVEWPEKIEELLPEDVLRIRLTELDEDTRRMEILE